jgi:transposase
MDTLYAGIDLHSNNNVVVVADEDDAVVYAGRLRNDLNCVLEALAPYKERLHGIVVESTYNWYWLVDGLMDAGYALHLANTGAIEQYAGLKFSDDESDSRWLAKLLRLNILPEGYIYPKDVRPVRDLLRKRRTFVKHHTATMLNIKNLIVRNTGCTVSVNRVNQITPEEVEMIFNQPELTLAVTSSLHVLHALKKESVTLEKAALARVRLRDEFKVLLSVPGIGRVLALVIMLETGEIGRFPTVGDYASYARCVGSVRISNGKKKGKGNTKCGNAHLAWAFSEAAVYAVRYDKDIQRWYQRKCAKCSHVMVARKAVAHKLARACYYMLRDQTRFDVKRAFV